MSEPARISPDALASRFQEVVSTQEYPQRVRIDGVQIIDLRLLIDDGGSFAELVRFDENGCLLQIPQFKVRQSSYSQVLPGAIKAFHLHYNQEDVWFVPPTDRLLIGLVDARKDSPTAGETMRFVMGAGKAQILYIPRGVGHGCANLGNVPSTILYYVNQHFNIADPDERRLPWDMLGKDFWEITQGEEATPMAKTETCHNCGSTDIANASLKAGNNDAQIVIAGKPDGFLGVIPYTKSPVSATVCRSCGYIMLFATQMTDLLAVDTKTDEPVF